MTNNELFYFTGKCLTLDEHPGFAEEIIQKISSETIEWQKFVGLCSNHFILPAIYLKFRSHHIVSHLPEVLAEFLKEVYQLNLSRNEQILKQVQEITKLLNENDIYPTYLKGVAHLVDNLYSDRGERMIGDIDLLVSDKDYLRTAGILENDGYATVGPCYADVEGLKHYPGLLKAGAMTHIEIHRLPVSEAQKRWFNTEIIDKEKKAVFNIDGCFVLSENHKIIHNFIHSQLGHDGHLYGIVSFRDIYDLYLISKRFDVAQTISQIQSKRKAIAYFVFAGKAFSLLQRFYPNSSFSAKVFCLKHDLNHNSRYFYYTFRSLIYLYKRILVGYTSQIVKSFYSESMRRSVIDRLANPQWYKDTASTYKQFFSPKKKKAE